VGDGSTPRRAIIPGVEGRARDTEPGSRWAWLVPWYCGGVASAVANATGAERAAHFAVGLLAGVAWQLLYRRDLTSRLAAPAVVAGGGIVAVLATRATFAWEDMDTAGLYAIGVLLGVFYTEHFQRLRDRARRGAGGRPEEDRLQTV
jgi:hypothetical protein